MDRLLWVCFGSALGGGMRYLVGLGALRFVGPGFPYATLTVNVVGSFLIGGIMKIGLTSTLISPTARLFLTTGIMGGLTTYSTFNYETLELLRKGSLAMGFLNLGVTVSACLLAGMLGLFAAEAILGLAPGATVSQP